MIAVKATQLLAEYETCFIECELMTVLYFTFSFTTESAVLQQIKCQPKVYNFELHSDRVRSVSDLRYCTL